MCIKGVNVWWPTSPNALKMLKVHCTQINACLATGGVDQRHQPCEASPYLKKHAGCLEESLGSFLECRFFFFNFFYYGPV